MAHDWRKYNVQPQCEDCGKFIPWERATVCGGLDSNPSPSWDEWYEGKCVKCEQKQATNTPP